MMETLSIGMKTHSSSYSGCSGVAMSVAALHLCSALRTVSSEVQHSEDWKVHS